MSQNLIEVDTPQYKFARMAVDKAKQCPIGGSSSNPLPKVAVVIARDDVLIGWCAKGCGGEYLKGGILEPFTPQPKEHAEQALLAMLSEHDLSAATAYVTLEPCTQNRGICECCANLLIKSSIKEIHIGNIDPNPRVGGLGWKLFIDNNIKVYDFPSELRNEARRDNNAFFQKFRVSVHSENGASFDYENNGGERVLGPAGREFKTRWTNRANGSIYALDYEFEVAIAKHCTKFDEVDDPGRWFEDKHYTKPVNEGEIVIFQNETGFALVKIVSVEMSTPHSNAQLKFEYQLRYPAQTAPLGKG